MSANGFPDDWSKPAVPADVALRDEIMHLRFCLTAIAALVRDPDIDISQLDVACEELSGTYQLHADVWGETNRQLLHRCAGSTVRTATATERKRIAARRREADGTA